MLLEHYASKTGNRSAQYASSLARGPAPGLPVRKILARLGRATCLMIADTGRQIVGTGQRAVLSVGPSALAQSAPKRNLVSVMCVSFNLFYVKSVSLFAAHTHLFLPKLADLLASK